MDGGTEGGVAESRRQATKRFVLSDEARSDLFGVWAFVVADNPPAADKLERDIMQACGLLARRPDIGHRRRDLCADASVRFHTVRIWYLVTYDLDTDPLRTVRILHGARDVARELTED